MKSGYLLLKNATWFGALIVVICRPILLTGATQKMTPLELVKRHLASIGTPEARAAIRNRIVAETATGIPWATPDSGAAKSAFFVSEGKSSRLSLPFSTRNGLGDAFVFDGKKFRSALRYDSFASIRSDLSNFVTSYDEIIKDGLMAGTLTTAWALLDSAGRRPRLEYNGLKQRGGKEYHELRYLARKRGGDGRMRVLMYFEPQTFRHVQTEYYRAAFPAQSNTLTEEFSDFAVVDGLTLPRTYKWRFILGNSVMCDRSVTFERIRHNQQLDPKTFVIK
jgi:hypothetical protein